MRVRHRKTVVAIATAVLVLVAAAGLSTEATAAGPGEATDVDADRFDAAVERVLDLPYDPAFVPTGTDAAFGEDDWPAAFPLTDTTTGTCCTGPVPDQPPAAELAPPLAAFPEGFELVELASHDGTPLHAFAAVEPGAPGVVVMHGFNTNGKHSVVRYAAFLRANGFSVIAPDHRDMGREWERGGSWSPDGTRRGQTLGWKEAEDLLVAAEELRARGAPSVDEVGQREEFAVDTLDGELGASVDVPALHLYADDDVLVPDYHARILASRTRQLAHQRTVLVEAGNHAYFYDRWWTQRAALEWFRTWLDPDGQATSVEPTIAQSPAGQPLREQVVDLSDTTREQGEAERDSEPVCEPAAEPIGPTALLQVDGSGPDRVLDGRRSWSGWDEHKVVAFELDPGDAVGPERPLPATGAGLAGGAVVLLLAGLAAGRRP